MTGAQTMEAWNAGMARAPLADPARLIGPGALVVLAPHPDDETIGCSALLLAAARLRRAVAVVAVTDGEASHRASRSFPPARLAQVRAAEQRAAVERLGCPEAEWLRLALPDGAAGRDPRLPACIEEVAALCERLGATAIAAPHPDDPHPDHHAAAAMALAIRARLPRIRVLFYEVWSRRLPGEAPFRARGLTPFRVGTDPAAKRAALDCHATQLGRVIGDDPGGFALPDWFLRAQDEPAERLSWLAMPGQVPGEDHFARLYADGGDPWHVRRSSYERRKREAAVAFVADRRFDRILEAGCGEGHLTGAMLRAGVAAQAVGLDRDPTIVARASAMGWGEGARFVTGRLPDALPEGPFDLAILSEVLYFLDEPSLGALALALRRVLVPGAELLLVSYLGRTDTPLAGREALDVFVSSWGGELTPVAATETPDYRMERHRWQPSPGAAPAGDARDPTGGAASGEGGG